MATAPAAGKRLVSFMRFGPVVHPFGASMTNGMFLEVANITSIPRTAQGGSDVVSYRQGEGLYSTEMNDVRLTVLTG